MLQELKNKIFIEKSISVHGESLFDYSNINYKNTTTQLELYCNIHKTFFKITPVAHLKGAGSCQLCFKESILKNHRSLKIGEIYCSTYGEHYKIINYESSENCTVLFNDGTILTNKHYGDIIRGQIKNPNRLLKLGVGYMGIGEYNCIKNKNIYKKWYNMLNRSYDNHVSFTSYIECSVTEEWHNFQVFAEWYEKNYNHEIMQGWHLDKDILIKGNKVYSSETCCFVPQKINCLFIKSNKSRGSLPIGVTYNKNRKVYCSRLRKDSKFVVKYHKTVEEAFYAYKQAKEEYIKEVADKYKDQITSKVYKALYNYQVEITD